MSGYEHIQIPRQQVRRMEEIERKRKAKEEKGC